MKHTNLTMGILFGFFLLCALSMGNRVYFVLATIIFLSWVFAFVSVRMAEKTVQVSNALSGQKVNRGEVVSMEIAVSHKGVLPIAPIALHMRATSNTPAGVIYLTHLGKRRQRVTHRFVADHVGTSRMSRPSAGVTSAAVRPSSSAKARLSTPSTFSTIGRTVSSSARVKSRRFSRPRISTR